MLGLSTLSLGLFGRAGALLGLPLLVLWGSLAYGKPGPGRLLGVAVGLVCAAAVGLLLQFATLALMGLSVTNTGGNFAPVLYGLASGSRDWTEAYRVHADLFARLGEARAFREIYGLAFAQIQAHPSLFAKSLTGALGNYFSGVYGAVFDQASRAAIAAAGLATLGILATIMGWPRRVTHVVLVLVIGELLSAPLVVDSGGQRVFAATAATRALLVGIGMQFLAVVALRVIGVRATIAGVPAAAQPSPRLASASAIAIMLLVVFSASPLSIPFRLKPLSDGKCPTGQSEFVLDLGAETLGLQLIDRSQQFSGDPWTVSRVAMVAGIGGTWFGESFKVLPTPVLIVHGTQRLAHGFGRSKDLLWFGDLSGERDKGVFSFCVLSGADISLAEAPYSVAASVRALR
jgi:hypothetical protein